MSTPKKPNTTKPSEEEVKDLTEEELKKVQGSRMPHWWRGNPDGTGGVTTPGNAEKNRGR